MIKNHLVKSHEKFVTASYPELLKRATVTNVTGIVACYVTGLLLWKLHNKLFSPRTDNATIEFKDEN